MRQNVHLRLALDIVGSGGARESGGADLRLGEQG